MARPTRQVYAGIGGGSHSHDEGIAMTGFEPDTEDRVHSEAPAEGDPDLDATEIRAHSEDPAEGPDED